MDSKKTRCANSFGSRGLVLERSGMIPAWAIPAPMSTSANLELTYYLRFGIFPEWS